MAPSIVANELSSPGKPLDQGTRSLMEGRFGQDFSRVRVHTDEQSAESAAAVQAKAYTLGRDVVFGQGEYAPGTGAGNRLLAHELTHVVQQSSHDNSQLPYRTVEIGERRVDQKIGRIVPDYAPQIAQRVQRLSEIQRAPFGIRLPSGARGLDPAEETILRGVYGSSLDYGDIYLSDALGGGGRPFTVYVPLVGTIIQIGPSAYTTPGSNPSLLIHEAAHSWQSQHHPNPAAYMANSIASQAGATAAGGDAYCYVPGKSFWEYAAEQIAQQIENGEAAIVAHASSASAGATDAGNVGSLLVPRWETRGASGVKC